MEEQAMTKKIRHHNYVRKLLYLRRLGLIPNGVHIGDIYHDDWCGIWDGKRCNCNPDIRLTPVPDPRRN
jgi:hypothetical protein